MNGKTIGFIFCSLILIFSSACASSGKSQDRKKVQREKRTREHSASHESHSNRYSESSCSSSKDKSLRRVRCYSCQNNRRDRRNDYYWYLESRYPFFTTPYMTDYSQYYCQHDPCCPEQNQPADPAQQYDLDSPTYNVIKQRNQFGS